jgi:hypothetical protein
MNPLSFHIFALWASAGITGMGLGYTLARANLLVSIVTALWFSLTLRLLQTLPPPIAPYPS